MIYLKSEQEIAKMKIAGKNLAELFEEIAKMIEPGLDIFKLDKFVETFIISKGMVPECKGYAGSYPASCCVSINDVVVHGIPKSGVTLQEGDVVSIDIVCSYQGYCADAARTFIVGEGSEAAQRLRRVTEDSFYAALRMVRPGNYVHDISAAVQDYVEKHGFFVVREFVGHGIGRSMHEDPQIPNFVSGRVRKKDRIKLVKGMTLAIEPMVLEQPDSVIIDPDRWTARSSTKQLAAHYEDTVLVTEDGCMVLTKL